MYPLLNTRLDLMLSYNVNPRCMNYMCRG